MGIRWISTIFVWFLQRFICFILPKSNLSSTLRHSWDTLPYIFFLVLCPPATLPQTHVHCTVLACKYAPQNGYVGCISDQKTYILLVVCCIHVYTYHIYNIRELNGFYHLIQGLLSIKDDWHVTHLDPILDILKQPTFEVFVFSRFFCAIGQLGDF